MDYIDAFSPLRLKLMALIFFYHEITKKRNHEKIPKISCFRIFVIKFKCPIVSISIAIPISIWITYYNKGRLALLEIIRLTLGNSSIFVCGKKSAEVYSSMN